MSPLRWSVLATQVPPGGSLGGIVRYTTELITALAARDDVVVSAVTTAAAADTLRELVGPRGQVSTVPSAPTPVLSVAERWLPRRLLPGDPDVVQGTKHLVPARSRALRVLTVHDMLLLDRPHDFGTAKRVLLPSAYRASIRDADLLLCVSAATRTRLEAHLPGSSERAEVVHLATSSTLRAATPQPVARLEGTPFALVVGDPTTRKNLRTVMAAWPAVRARHPDAVLAVAGPPSWGRTELGELFDRLVADGAVVALGHIDDAGLRWAYEHAQVVLCPSLAEGYGLPAAEALDLGAPVIISEDPAMQEVCAGRARAVLPATDVDAWSGAVADALDTPRAAAPPTGPGTGRTWADVAEESVRAVRRVRER